MSLSLWERFKEWVCSKIGHNSDGETWEHAGKIHSCCTRCRIVYTVKEIDKEATK